MLKTYNYSREQIISFIKNEYSFTKEGIYWCPCFNFLCFDENNGKYTDEEYYYEREIFSNVMYLTEKEIEVFLSPVQIDKFDINLYKDKTNRFYETNFELFSFNVWEKVPYNLFTVGELVDYYEYFNCIF